jgi:hypothetical protein
MPSATTTTAAENGPDNDDDEIEVIADPTVENGETGGSSKRLSDVTDEARLSKRAKSMPSSGDVIEIED